MNTNVAASIQQRLLNIAHSTGQDFQRILDQFVLERVLYRLSQSEHRALFVLKGAALYYLSGTRSPRPTRDLDLMAQSEASLEAMESIFREICAVACPEDGLSLDPSAVHAKRIRETNRYQGVRMILRGTLGTARLTLQVDVGFGDAISPRALETQFPSMLGLPEAVILAYRWETFVSEKCEAMVVLGMANTRMKDFFDIWHLVRTDALDQLLLKQALRATFNRRGTPWPVELPDAMSARFSQDPQKALQWLGFLRKSGIDKGPELPEVIDAIRAFLWPHFHA
ncbi:MAG: nucleotidyl transferase AbiEii/AbiGii toxin family protein [Holophagaceae bacterium]